MYLKIKLSALTVVALSMQLAVPSVFAISECTISALDTVAGLGTEVSVRACAGSTSTTLEVRGPANERYTQAITLDATGNATTLIPSKHTVTIGQYTVTVAEKTTSFSVIADRVDDSHSLLATSRQRIKADGKEEATVTAVLRDRYDNPIVGRPLALISSRVSDDIEPLSKQTDEEGQFLWTVRSTQNGQMSLVIYDIVSARQLKLKADLIVGNTVSMRASLTGQEMGGDTVTEPASIASDRLEIELLPRGGNDVQANEQFSVKIRAMHGTDVLRGYIGTLVIRSSDPDATLPKKGSDPLQIDTGSVDLRAVDQGERSVPLAFALRRKGTQTIEFADKQNPAMKGTLTLNVSRDGESSDGAIVIIEPKDQSRVSGTFVILQGRAPSLVNLKVIGGKEIVNAESDAEGVFRNVRVELNPDHQEETLFVTSERGEYQSDPIHIFIDTTKPIIETITIDPAETKATQSATISIKSESGLSTVTAVSGTQTITLKENSGAITGLYTGVLVAPAKDGVYDVTVTVTDSVQNSSTMLTKWTVKPNFLPIVQKVTAESRPATVFIQWEPVASLPIAEYVIYIAENNAPTNYLYSIRTKKPVTSAVIKDLPLGITYQFSVTAIAADGSESPEKSTAALASPLGMSFVAISNTGSLLLQWTSIANLPLDHYVLQFGTTPGVYTEQRTINGKATSFPLRDLIDGVMYELRLTPVTVTGKQMNDLAAVTRGTPGGTGFSTGIADPVPTEFIGHPGAPLEPSPILKHVPQNVGSGISTVALIIVFFGTLAGLLQWRHIKNERLLAHAFLKQMEERYHS